jgi:hypothetical protein
MSKISAQIEKMVDWLPGGPKVPKDRTPDHQPPDYQISSGHKQSAIDIHSHAGQI